MANVHTKIMSKKTETYGYRAARKRDVVKEFMNFLSKCTSAKPGESHTIVGESSGTKKGYYIMGIIRDEDAKDGQRIQISTIGENMPMEDIIYTFEAIINDVIKASTKKIAYA